MITPTVGRVVLYHPYDAKPGDQPLAAIITYVANDHDVHLCVFGPIGEPKATPCIPLVQEGEAKPVECSYCEWMPYQTGQAKASQVVDTLQANAFTSFFAGLFTHKEETAVVAGVTTFISTDVGALTLDAVQYVEASMPGAAGKAKRDAAVAKLKVDAATAGKDLSGFAASTLNWFIEMALQALIARGLQAIHAGDSDLDAEPA